MTQSLTSRPTDGSVAADPLRPRTVAEVDWPRWVRQIERKRRLVKPARVWPGWVYRDGTQSSFLLEGIDVAADDLAEALAPGRSLRSRQSRRLRVHLAILRSLDRRRHGNRRLTPVEVMQWYTSISGGLSTSALAPAGLERLMSVVRRINSPQRRLQPAVSEAAKLHAELLADPMFPGFNAILARLLLVAHLTGSGLPAIVFDPARDHWHDPTASAVTVCLLERLDAMLDRLAASGTAGFAPPENRH